MSEWISVDDRLPEEGEWVSVFQNKAAYSEIGENEEPVYWYSQDYYYAKMMGTWMNRVTSAQLRLIDCEGYAEWEQGRMPSGHAFTSVDYVTHWQPLPDPPK